MVVDSGHLNPDKAHIFESCPLSFVFLMLVYNEMPQHRQMFNYCVLTSFKPTEEMINGCYHNGERKLRCHEDDFSNELFCEDDYVTGQTGIPNNAKLTSLQPQVF